MNTLEWIGVAWLAAAILTGAAWSLAFRKWGTPTPETPIVKARS
jgi:hypothetical protein